MQALLLSWRMWELTHNMLFLAAIALVEAIPALSLALPAGLYVDRNPPLRVLRQLFIAAFLSALSLFLSQLPQLAFGTSAQVGMLLGAASLSGVSRAFSQPAAYAFVPRIVAREDLARASASMSAMFQTGRILGPTLAGVLVGRIGIEPTACLVCAFQILGLLGLFSIETPIEPARQTGPARSRRSELFSGAAYVFRHPILLPALSLDMISVLFGGVTGVLPVYASDVLHVGPDGLGAMQTATAVGAMAMSAWLIRRRIRRHAGALLFAAVAGFGLSILVFAVSRDFYLTLAALALSGAFDCISVVIRSAAVQLASPNDLRGRISAVNSIFIGSSNELGSVESNVAAWALGLVPSVIFGGIMCLLTALVTSSLAPALRHLDLQKLEEESKSSAEC
jgi:MFS family permease